MDGNETDSDGNSTSISQHRNYQNSQPRVSTGSTVQPFNPIPGPSQLSSVPYHRIRTLGKGTGYFEDEAVALSSTSTSSTQAESDRIYHHMHKIYGDAKNRCYLKELKEIDDEVAMLKNGTHRGMKAQIKAMQDARDVRIRMAEIVFKGKEEEARCAHEYECNMHQRERQNEAKKYKEELLSEWNDGRKKLNERHHALMPLRSGILDSIDMAEQRSLRKRVSKIDNDDDDDRPKPKRQKSLDSDKDARYRLKLYYLSDEQRSLKSSEIDSDIKTLMKPAALRGQRKFGRKQ
eukprot:UC4_evm12s805